MPIKMPEAVDEFEAAFRSTWETAKKKGVLKSDVEGEIVVYRKILK